MKEDFTDLVKAEMKMDEELVPLSEIEKFGKQIFKEHRAIRMGDQQKISQLQEEVHQLVDHNKWMKKNLVKALVKLQDYDRVICRECQKKVMDHHEMFCE